MKMNTGFHLNLALLASAHYLQTLNLVPYVKNRVLLFFGSFLICSFGAILLSRPSDQVLYLVPDLYRLTIPYLLLQYAWFTNQYLRRPYQHSIITV